MKKVRPWCGQPSDQGRLKNRTGTTQVKQRQTYCDVKTNFWLSYFIYFTVTGVFKLITMVYLQAGRLGSRVVSVLDSTGAAGPGFKPQSRRCRVTVLCKLFTPIAPLFTKQQNW